METKGYVKNVKLDRVFNYAIGKYFLEPYGLNNEVPVALNKKHAEDILQWFFIKWDT